MKIYNSKADALKDLGHAQKIDKTAFPQRVWSGNRHVWGLRVGLDLWFAGEGKPPVKVKQAEDPEPQAAAAPPKPPTAPPAAAPAPSKK